MITIDVKERPCGVKFDACLPDGTVIYTGRTPHFGAARELLVRGHSAHELMHTRVNGTISFRSSVGRMASLSVKDSTDGKSLPKLRTYVARETWPS